jgi:PAS domain S-box-containing protein
MDKHCHGSDKQIPKNVADTKSTRKFCNKVYENSRFENILQENFCLNSILNVMVNPVACKDKSGLYLFVNRAFEKLLGLPAKEIIEYTRLEVGKKVSERAEGRTAIKEGCFQQAFSEWDQIDMEILRSGSTRTFEQEIACADGVKRVFLVNISALNDEKKEIQGLVTVLQDVTELKKSENALEENDEKYRIVTEQTGQLVYDFDLTTDEGSWAGAIEKVTGYSTEELRNMDRDFWVENIHPADRDRVIKEFIISRKTGKSYRVEFRFIKKDGTYICLENNGIYLTDKSGNPVRSLGAMKDITARKLAEEKMQESEDKYRSFVQNLKGIAFQFDRDFNLEFMHGTVEEITGYSEEELVSSRLWAKLIEPEDLSLFLEEQSKIRQCSGDCQGELDYRIRCRNGKIKWMHETYQKVPGKGEKPDVYNGIIYDITEKKEAEETLAKVEMARKKEVHHRIKNNLQVISSLLDLQAENLGDERVKEILRESQNRIMSIALIHRELYRDREMNNVNFSTYLRELAENLLNTYKIGDSRVSLYMNLEENILLDVDTAVPLGIIINEIFSNSLKYAFPDRKPGEILINLVRERPEKLESKHWNERENQDMERDTRFTLTVSDNGVGIPETFDIEKSDRLGLQLIHVLIDQLDGKVKLNRNNGTEFIIEFAAQDYSKKI